VTWANDDATKANILGKSFSSVFINNVTYAPTAAIKTVSCGRYVVNELMPDVFFSEKTVFNKLNKLNVYKSAGPDEMYPKILCECSASLSRFLSLFYTNSLNDMKLPNEWKLSLISAVYKKGDRDLPLNYRPISLTCVACKVMESIIKDCVMDHFTRNRLFHVNQYGFMKGRSTSLQLLKLMDLWSEAVDMGNEIDVLYTDFEKAFDKVNHEKLLLKLNMYGVNGNVVGWIKEYITNRKFQVRVNGKLSECFYVKSGVPQGSVLGPVLFIIYVNDIFELCDGKIEMYLYADDAKLFTVIKSANDQFLLQMCINSLVEWCDVWDIRLNVDKCQIVQYNFKGFNYEYKAGDFNLKVVDNIKDLGVVFENNFKFSKHIDNKVSKANSVLGLIKRNFCNLTTNVFLLLYKSLVRPHLEYAVDVWMPHEKNKIEIIEQIQKRATKLVKECKSLSYDDRLKLLNVPTLSYRRARGDMIKVFKMLCMNDGSKEWAPRFIRPTYDKTRGHKFKLQKSTFKLNIRRFYFTNRVVDLWNGLPESVVMSESVPEFERRLDDCWVSVPWKYMYKEFDF